MLGHRLNELRSEVEGDMRGKRGAPVLIGPGLSKNMTAVRLSGWNYCIGMCL